jgi:RHS repeat-associated protein
MNRSNAMTVQRDTLLCRYHYDPLDRVASCAPLAQSSVQRFYRKDRLATEIQGQVQYSVFEHEAQLLAQQRHDAGRMATALLATDLQRSVLHSVAAGQQQRLAYSPYGHRTPESGLISLLGFNGERRDSVTGHYLLGNGYRAFNPVLMRFNSPDSLSPFGKGGLNAYAYSLGDPVNFVDPMGEFPLIAITISQLTSASVSAMKQAGKSLSAVMTSVKSSFSKMTKRVAKNPPRASPLNKLIDESRDQVKLRQIGDEFALVKKADEPPPIARFAQTKGYSEQELFAQKGFIDNPEVQKQYFHSQQPEAIERLREADVKLLVATGIHIKKYPHSEQSTRALVAQIRSQ